MTFLKTIEFAAGIESPVRGIQNTRDCAFMAMLIQGKIEEDWVVHGTHVVVSYRKHSGEEKIVVIDRHNHTLFSTGELNQGDRKSVV